MTYDSRPDTLEHIGTVRRFIVEVIDDLRVRMARHDQSKLAEPEKSVFDEYTPKLADSTYGSDEYKGFLVGMQEGLKHHYAVNDHHPEHWPRGIRDMSMCALMEMLADWKAATLRHKNGDLRNSIYQNAERFGYGEEIERLLLVTAEELGWL
jgi:hypothetical protein